MARAAAAAADRVGTPQGAAEANGHGPVTPGPMLEEVAAQLEPANSTPGWMKVTSPGEEAAGSCEEATGEMSSHTDSDLPLKSSSE